MKICLFAFIFGLNANATEDKKENHKKGINEKNKMHHEKKKNNTI